jgi:hypothetical protein
MSIKRTFTRLTIVLLSAISMHVTGCAQSQVRARVLKAKNPTSYEFDAPLKRVKTAITNAFGLEWRREQEMKTQIVRWGWHSTEVSQGAALYWKGQADVSSRNLLTKPGNEDDAYLEGSLFCVGRSQIYFRKGQPLVYFADFHIHLAAVNPQKTRVEIFTYGPRVVAGVSRFHAHGPAFVFVDVAPTSVEEYQILLRIGEQLGAKDMPSLVVPKPDAERSKP